MFEEDILRLASAIREKVSNHKTEKSVPKRRVVRIRRRDFTLKYQDDFGFANFPPTRIEEDAWDWEDQERFAESVIKCLPEYESVASKVGANLGAVDTFSRQVAIASLRGLSDGDMSDRATTLGRELAGEPLAVKITAFINGLSLSDSPLIVSDELVLRRPTEEDLAEYILLDEHGGFSFPKGDTWFRVVGEFVFHCVSTGLAQTQLLRTLESLRFFRVGGVAASRYEMRSGHSFLQGGGTRLFTPGQTSQFKYTLSSDDAAALAEFIRGVAPIVPDPLGGTKTEPAEIACARYSAGLFHSGPSEEVATSAITALEALFLKREERSELSHRLAQRISVFLRVLGVQPDAVNTYKSIKKGYDIRSTYIHGGKVEQRDPKNINDLVRLLLDFARVSALAFLQIKASKTDLLDKLDESMIEPASTRSLEALLASVVHK